MKGTALWRRYFANFQLRRYHCKAFLYVNYVNNYCQRQWSIGPTYGNNPKSQESMGMRSKTKQNATKRNMKGSKPIEAKRTKRNITKRCKQSEMIAVELKQKEVNAKQQPVFIIRRGKTHKTSQSVQPRPQVCFKLKIDSIYVCLIS